MSALVRTRQLSDAELVERRRGTRLEAWGVQRGVEVPTPTPAQLKARGLAARERAKVPKNQALRDGEGVRVCRCHGLPAYRTAIGPPERFSCAVRIRAKLDARAAAQSVANRDTPAASASKEALPA